VEHREHGPLGLFDNSSEEPKSKRLRYAVTAVALVILVTFGVWFFFLRFLGERHTVQSFMNAVVTGNYQLAYQIWKPHGTYSFDEFMADWGTKGYWGPIGSYRIEAIAPPRDASGVIVVVEISPFQPFPADNDPKSGRNREVRIWVERSDNSLSFPP
jgi:hypothetical protein